MTQVVNTSQTHEKTFSYDLKGRQKSIREYGLKDGILHHSFIEYNRNDLPRKKIDKFGNETHYSYEHFSQKPSEIIHPFFYTSKGAMLVREGFPYDVLGRQLKHVDPNENATEYTYNAYGLPATIVYADKSTEIFSYTKAGKLPGPSDKKDLPF